jgi:glycosyltransferase involved in cell wall biosynthesis
MKILICNKFYFEFGGTDVYLLQLEKMLREKGHEVAFFSTDHPSNKQSQYQKFFVKYVDFKAPRLSLISRLRHVKRIIYYGQAKKKIRSLVKEFRPDVAHVRNIYHHISPSILWELKAQGIPIVYHINDFKSICPNYNLVSHGRVCEKCKVGKFWHVLTERCHSKSLGSNLTLCAEAYTHKWLGTYTKCVGRFIAPSQFCRNKLIEHGVNRNKIDVLYHFQTIPRESERHESQDYILYFGRLTQEKGLRDLLEAMQVLRNIELVIAGDGPEAPALQAWASARSLSNVRFMGKLDGVNLERVVRGSRFTVMPSLVYETLGKVILESYAQGRPVIASRLGTRPEIVKDGITGLLFEPYSFGDLAEKIAYLYAHPEKCDRMGEEGKKLLIENHSPQEHYERLLQIYRRVCEESIHV